MGEDAGTGSQRPGRRRNGRVLALAVLVGAVVGLAVAAFEQVVGLWLADWTLGLPVAARIAAPVVGLVVAGLVLRFLGRGASPATADEYLVSYHVLDGDVLAAPAPAKVLATAATLGSGGALGFEGPSIYLGTLIGGLVGRRARRLLGPGDRRALVVAGAAAGVAAIFKTPATGAVFALEVPYQEDSATHAIGPAILGAAAGYLVYAVFFGFDRLFPIRGDSPLHAAQLLGAIALGVAAGLGARAFAAMTGLAKWVLEHVPRVAGVAGAGAMLIVLGTVTWVVYDAPLTFGSGVLAIGWSSTVERSILLLGALVVVRLLATTATLAGGGAGGVFFPLFSEGWLLGAILAVILHDQSLLYPAVGAAAFLGAGYRVPIAGVVFVAESTGRPGFIVPALVATAVAQLTMGRASVTRLQRMVRRDRLARELDRPVTDALVGVPTAVPGDRLADVAARGRFAALVDDGRFVGLLDVVALGPAGPEATIGGALPPMPAVGPVADPTWTLGRARELLTGGTVEVLPVCVDGELVGVVTAASLLARVAAPES